MNSLNSAPPKTKWWVPRPDQPAVGREMNNCSVDIPGLAELNQATDASLELSFRGAAPATQNNSLL